jgi:hypothetical protein
LPVRHFLPVADGSWRATAQARRLVAHHSCAIIEAEVRGLADILGFEFEPASYPLSSVLTFCDMTTSPDGKLAPVEGRLADIEHRYSPRHLVSRSIRRATPMILRAVEQVRRQSHPKGYSFADRKSGNAQRAWPWLEPGPIGSRNGSRASSNRSNYFSELLEPR